MKITAEPRSDQWNAEDFVSGKRVFTIAGVRVGKAEAKYDVDLVEGQGRCWRPPLTVLRLLISAWGTDEASEWVGRRVELYLDREVMNMGEKVGGIRVSAVSHISRPVTARLATSRGKRASFTVQPLPDTKPAPTENKAPGAVSAIRTAAELTQLDAIHTHARSLGIDTHPDIVGALEQRRKELT